VLFESGAILLHIARKSEVLMPADAKDQARVSAWMFAALNSIEPRVDHLTGLDVFHAGEEWAKGRKPGALKDAQVRLSALSDWLDGRDYLENRFTVADLLMTTVLRTLGDSNVMTQMPTLKAYWQRCEARPAFGRALAAQMADFTDTMPAVA
jgi:glutathione S-transferase